jgi:copper(I)-binding protein
MRRIGGLPAALAAVALWSAAFAGPVLAGDIAVTGAWTPASPKGAVSGAGYFVVRNVGAIADRLVGGSADFATIEIHAMAMKGGVMKMGAAALEAPAHGELRLQPGGSHVMFVDLKRPLKGGDRLKATLFFERAGAVTVDFIVKDSDAGMKGMDMPGMAGMKM